MFHNVISPPFIVVIQARHEGGTSSNFFNKTWADYQNGFTDEKNNDKWMGLDNIHQLTSNRTWSLVVELTDWDDVTYMAKYATIVVGDEESKYKLTIGAFDASTSTLGDSLTAYANGAKFSTSEVDNDTYESGNCLTRSRGGGGWWTKVCGTSNLNGEYGQSKRYRGIYWKYGGQRGNKHDAWKGTKMMLVNV